MTSSLMVGIDPCALCIRSLIRQEIHLEKRPIGRYDALMGKSEITRDAVLDAALHEASLTGVAQLTLGPVAAAAGRSKGGLLRHFPSKERLQIAVLERAFIRFQQHVFEPALKAPNGLPRLRVIMECWFKWPESAGLPGGCPILSAHHEFDDLDSDVREHLHSAWSRWHTYLTRQAHKAQEASQLPPELSPEALVTLMIGLKSAAQLEQRLLKHRDANRNALQLFDRLTS
jgi:AcrR family transcriptional regulator